MKTWLVTGVALGMLSGCGGSPEAVGENSAGSIKTTAVGEVVGTIATPTPTPLPTAENNDTDATSNDTAEAVDAAADAVDNAAAH